MTKEAENGESWCGIIDDDECLKRARIFIRRLEKLTELCIFNPNRKLDIDDKKKKVDDDDAEEGDENKEEFDYLNLSELKQLWDNEDPKICEDD